MGISSVKSGSDPQVYSIEGSEAGQSEGTTTEEDQGAVMLDMMLCDSILGSTNEAKRWLDELSNF